MFKYHLDCSLLPGHPHEHSAISFKAGMAVSHWLSGV